MKILKTIIALAAIVAVASPAFAACTHKPLDGSYTSASAAVLLGRASEAFCGGVGAGVPGNTQDAESWNGTALGTQWKISGMTIDPAGAVETGRYFYAPGFGYIDYVTNYTGGQFWLSGAGPWGDGLGDFTGSVTYYNLSTRVTYVAGNIVGITSGITFHGSFDACSYCFLDYGLSTAILVWRTGNTAPMPANYPAFLCGANTGELYDVCDVSLHVFCNVTGTQPSTWGAVKELFR